MLIERLMMEDLNFVTTGPSGLTKGLNARSWVELRSRIDYRTSVFSSWSAAGILDSLMAGQI